MFKRIALFILTNLAVMLVIGVVLHLLGLDRTSGHSMGNLLAYAAVIGFTGSFISLLMSKWTAKMATGAVVIETPQTQVERWLVDTVSDLSQRAGIGMPEVAIYEADDPNAFATGAFRNSSLVAVSTGLLEGMDNDEVRAVLAHEVSHIANGDMVTMTLLQGVMNTFVVFLSRIIGNIVDKAVFKSDGPSLGTFLVTIVLQLVLGILAALVVNAFSRHREYRADAGAASLVGPDPMIRALARLHALSEAGNEPALPQKVAAFGIRGGSMFGNLLSAEALSTHPLIEKRIAALRDIQRGVA